MDRFEFRGALGHLQDILFTGFEHYVAGFDNYATKMGVMFACLFALFFFEVAVVGWEASALRRILHPKGSTRTDLLTSAFTIVGVWPLVGLAFSLGTFYIFSAFLRNITATGIKLEIQNPVLNMALYIIVLDFLSYWTHRTVHSVDFLWQFHRFHHSASEMNFITGLRLHPMELAFSSFVFAVPLAYLRVPVEFPVTLLVIRYVKTFIQHSNLQYNWGLIGKYLLVSPLAHRAHHAKDPSLHNRNFGGIFQTWDVIFGTSVHLPSSRPAIPVGLDDDDGGYRFFPYVWNRNSAFVLGMYQAICNKIAKVNTRGDAKAT